MSQQVRWMRVWLRIYQYRATSAVQEVVKSTLAMWKSGWLRIWLVVAGRL